jgi:hypothetical protein
VNDDANPDESCESDARAIPDRKPMKTSPMTPRTRSSGENSRRRAATSTSGLQRHSIADKWARGIVEKDPATVAAAREDLLDVGAFRAAVTVGASLPTDWLRRRG